MYNNYNMPYGNQMGQPMGGIYGMQPQMGMGNPMMGQPPSRLPMNMQQFHQDAIYQPGEQLISSQSVFNAMQPTLQRKSADSLKKVFIRNIPEDLPDEFLAKLMKCAGPVNILKRAKNERDVPMSFGYCEYETIEAVLRSLRVVQGLVVLDKPLSLKPAEKTEMFISEWTELKRREFEALNKRDDNEDDDAREQKFEQFLRKDDQDAIDKIERQINSIDMEKIKDEKEKQALRKQHPRERTREINKEQQAEAKYKKYQEMLIEWVKREQDKDKESKRQNKQDQNQNFKLKTIIRERDEKSDIEKKRLLQRELEYDSDEEKRKKEQMNPYKILDRKKMRQRELELDELEKKRELLLTRNPEEPIYEIIPKIEEEIKEEKKKKPTFIFQQDIVLEDSSRSKRESSGGISMNLQNKSVQQQHFQYSSAFKTSNQVIEEPTNDKYQQEAVAARKQEGLKKITDTLFQSQQQHQIKIDMHKREAVIDFSSRNKSGKDASDIKKELESIIKRIPHKKSELFSSKINWEIFESQNLIEKKVRPWLVTKSIEYVGVEEPNFIQLIIKKISHRESPQDILSKVEKVLEEDAEEFVVKMWRMLIFEIQKAELNI